MPTVPTPRAPENDPDAWCPFTEAERRPWLHVIAHDIARVGGGALYCLDGDTGVVIVAPELAGADLAQALTHELVHDERRILNPQADRATMRREEAVVRRITRERMARWTPATTPPVPAGAVAAFRAPQVVAG